MIWHASSWPLALPDPGKGRWFPLARQPIKP